MRDIKRKAKHYADDIRDGFNIRCLVSIIFIFFATLAPTLSFGALLMKKTNDALGVLETLLATSICGVLFSLTSGQPLIIVGTTGPILVFEEVVATVSTFIFLRHNVRLESRYVYANIFGEPSNPPTRQPIRC